MHTGNATALMKQTNGSDGTCETQDSLVRHFLVRLAELYDCELSSVVYSIWTDALNDQCPNVLASAFRKLERTFKPTAAAPFPTPAHLLDLINDARGAAIEDEAQSAWEHLLDRVRSQYHPDLGWKGPSLDPRIDHATRVAGGVRWISVCPEADLVWCKKRFIECYLRDQKLIEDHALLSPAPEISMLIDTVAKTRVLESARTVTPSIHTNGVPTVGMRSVEPSTRMTDQQFEAGKKVLHEQAERLNDKGIRIAGN